MELFGVGITELILIFIIMLIVAGPKRMIRWAYVLGVYASKLQVLWRQTMAAVQQEINAAGVDMQLPQELPTRQNLTRWAGNAIQQVAKPLESDLKAVNLPEKPAWAQFTQGIKPVPPEPPQQPEADFGAWSQAETTPKPNENTFGSWSQPKKE